MTPNKARNNGAANRMKRNMPHRRTFMGEVLSVIESFNAELASKRKEEETGSEVGISVHDMRSVWCLRRNKSSSSENSEFQNDGAFTDAFALFVELGESSDAQNSSG